MHDQVVYPDREVPEVLVKTYEGRIGSYRVIYSGTTGAVYGEPPVMAHIKTLDAVLADGFDLPEGTEFSHHINTVFLFPKMVVRVVADVYLEELDSLLKERYREMVEEARASGA